LFVVVLSLVLLYSAPAPHAAGLQSFIYVAATSDAIASPYVLVIDAATLGVVTRIPMPANSGQRGMAISPDGNHLYVLNTAGLIDIDLTTHTVAGVAGSVGTGTPSGMGRITIRNDGGQAFASSQLQFEGAILSWPLGGAAPVTVNTGIVVQIGPDAVASPTSARLYVDIPGHGGIHEFDAKTGADLATIASADRSPLAIAPDGARLYSSQLAAPGVAVIDTATRAQIGAFDDTNANRVFAGLKGKYVYTLSGVAGVRVYDASSIASAPVLIAPLSLPGVNLVASEDESRIFVATALGMTPGSNPLQTNYTNGVVAIDRASGHPLAQYSLPDSTHFGSFSSRDQWFIADGVTPMAATLPGTPRCSYRLNTSTSTWTTTGGSGSVTLTTGCSWVASSDASWIHLQQTSGTTGGTIDFTVDAAAAGAGRNGTLTIGGQLVSVSQAGYGVNPPYGVFDTPASGSVLAGSVAVTGWALDDVGVNSVQIWRDPHPSDPSGAIYQGPGPQAGRIFIGYATFVDGARPDVAAVFPTAPQSTRAGWGYLMLTRGIVWDGKGMFNLYAYAVDVEGNIALLGSKAVTINNAAATRPFGAIDTPPPGSTISGFYAVTGWVLTPNAGATIPPAGVRVSVDDAFLPDVPGVSDRADITAGFPGFDTTGAGRGLFLDTTKYADGLHTIGFLVTDSAGQSDGVGGRFFTIDNASPHAAAGIADARNYFFRRPATNSAGVSTRMP
jgi:hypothetical protein